MIFEVNHQFVSHGSQSPIGSVKERVSGKIISRLKPFPLEHPPKNLGDVKLRRIWRQEEKMQPSLLPYVPKCEQSFGPVYGRIVKHDHGLAPDGHGEVVQKTDHRVGINAFPACEPMGMTTAVNHGEAVEPRSSLRRYVNVFFGKFPAVWHICFLTDMGFISVIKVYGTFVPQPFKLLQLPKLVLVELRRGFTFGRFLMRPNLAPMRLKNA